MVSPGREEGNSMPKEKRAESTSSKRCTLKDWDGIGAHVTKGKYAQHGRSTGGPKRGKKELTSGKKGKENP